MEIQFSDDYLEKLPHSTTLSTINSEGSIDDIMTLRHINENLKKDLEKMTEEYRLLKKIADQQSEKDQEIESLRTKLEEMTIERDKFKKELNSFLQKQTIHKPIANPLQTVLIDYLVKKDLIKTQEVENVMRSIDRGDFCPKDPYVDRPQQLGFNTTISAPHMHATQLELLKDCLNDAKKAVDIGTGSGFVALSIAKMMMTKGKDFKVYGVDHIPKLVEQARENVEKNHKEYLENDQIEFLVGDGREGLPQFAPFDVIFVGGAVKEIPDVFIDQLAPGGSLLIPVGEFFQYLMVVHKTKSGKIEKNPVMAVQFGKLQTVEEQCPDIDE